MKLHQAQATANTFLNLLAPACTRIEIVGSVKRADKDDIHDIEILMVLNGKRPRPVFGVVDTPATHLDAILRDLKRDRILRDPLKVANGEKYKKFAICDFSEWNEFCLDLFIVTPQTWGIQNVIRTGPKLFSHSFVVNQSGFMKDKDSGRLYHGLLPDQYTYVRGETCIMQGDTILELPEESDAIALLGHGWIEPGNRKHYIREVKR